MADGFGQDDGPTDAGADGEDAYVKATDGMAGQDLAEHVLFLTQWKDWGDYETIALEDGPAIAAATLSTAMEPKTMMPMHAQTRAVSPITKRVAGERLR